MKRFPIFRPGKHTTSAGEQIEFSSEMLKAAVAAYDPGVHEAPIVVGHPKENHPAYGWIKGMEFDEADGTVYAVPGEVEAQFSDLVEQGRYKKRSASWYMPDSPSNPTPGKLHLRHVGFLGAQPPALKGLKDVTFADGEKGVVEFGDQSRWLWGSIAAALRGMREWLIEEKGQDVADKKIPNYLISDLETEARKQPDPFAVSANYTETTEHSTMSPEQIKTLQDKLAATETELAAAKANAKPADFAEREKALKEGETKLARSGVESQVDKLIADGKLAPARKAQTIDFAMALDNASATVEFTEGEKTEKLSARAHYLRQLEASPKVVDFSERSKAKGNEGEPEDIDTIQRKISSQVATAGKAK